MCACALSLVDLGLCRHQSCYFGEDLESEARWFLGLGPHGCLRLTPSQMPRLPIWGLPTSPGCISVVLVLPMALTGCASPVFQAPGHSVVQEAILLSAGSRRQGLPVSHLLAEGHTYALGPKCGSRCSGHHLRQRLVELGDQHHCPHQASLQCGLCAAIVGPVA